jgi:hypothetical protein
MISRLHEFQNLQKYAGIKGFNDEILFKEGNRFDVYFSQKLSFPMASRDFVVCHQILEDLWGYAADVGFSIQRPDKLPNKQYVRGKLSKR